MRKIIIFILIMLLFPFLSGSQINSSNYEADVVISSGGENVSSSNYNMDTMLSTITGNTSSTLYQQSLGFFFCTPDTCSSLGYSCGIWDDGCGKTLNCGACAAGSTCTSGICVVDTVPPSNGGNGAVTPTVNIAVEPTEINIKLPVNREEVRYVKSVEQIVKVTNLGSNEVTVNLRYNGLDGIYVDFKNISYLTLAGGETKSFTVVFTAGSEENTFVGNILVGTKQIPTSLNVGEFILFDSNIVVLNRDYKISQGDTLKTEVTLVPMGDPERLDVTLNYVIKDYGGEIYLTKSETILVEKRVNFKRNFETGNLPLGKYIVGLELIYIGGVAPSSAHFEIVQKSATDFLGSLIFFLIVAILILAIFIIFLIIRRQRKKEEIAVK